MSAFNGLLDNFGGEFLGGLLNPKGNLGDWRHASRTFALNTFRLAPKAKFLYHVAFTFSPLALKGIPNFENKHKVEAGLLVKSASLPGFTSAVETKKKYNRVKNVQTSLQYEPVTITFHDDNLGITSGLLEAYYRYYFADGHYGNDTLKRAYNKLHSPAGGTTGVEPTAEPANGSASTTSKYGDSTYKAADASAGLFKFGLDAGSTDPFFVDIQITQMSRSHFTTFTLVNPIITQWKHGDLDYSDGGVVENSITVAYEAVWYDRGKVVAGADGNPKGFGVENHYDHTPSPITLAGGAPANLGDILGGAVDLWDYALNDGDAFNNPIAAALAGVNLLGGLRNLDAGTILQEGTNILSDIADSGAGLGGITDVVFK